MFEDPRFTALRVKLFRKGFSQNEITELFKNFKSPEELLNQRKIVEKVYQIMNESVNGNSQTLGMIQEIVKIYMATADIENVNEITIKARKRQNRWGFVVSAN